MLVISPQQMRDIDARTINELKIPGIVLMENAALAVVRLVEGQYTKSKNDRILVAAGTGNNGGDGFAIARHLITEGYTVTIFVVGEREHKGDAGLNLDILKKLIGQDTSNKSEIINLRDKDDLEKVQDKIADSNLVIDAILGTGLDRNVKGIFSELIAAINKSGRPVVAVDIPSGIHGDNGKVMGAAVVANATVTFAYLKKGHLLYPGREYLGELYLSPISIPASSAKAIGADKIFTLEKCEASSMLKYRPTNSHKGTFGKVAVIAGSRGLTGAAYLTSMAAMRSGAGLVTLGIPASLNPIMEAKLTEVMTLPLEDEGQGQLTNQSLPDIQRLTEDKDVLAIGPGLGNSNEVLAILRYIFGKINISIVIDADGLNHISRDIDLVARHEAPVILTPHPGEMARLMDCDISKVLDDPIEHAKALSDSTRAVVLLKGAATIVAEPVGRVYINNTGNNGMAKGGSGDLLTGMIASLLAQGYKPFDAAVLGCFVHGRSGDLAAKTLGKIGMTPEDMLKKIPEGFEELYSLKDKGSQDVYDGY